MGIQPTQEQKDLVMRLTNESASNPAVMPGDAAAMLAAQLKDARYTIDLRNADLIKGYNDKCDAINYAKQQGMNFDAAGWWPKVPMAWELGPKEPPFDYQYATQGNTPVCPARELWALPPANPPGSVVFGNVEAGGQMVGADKSDTAPFGVMLGPMPGPPDGKPHRYMKFNWAGFGSKYQIFPPE